MDRRHFILDDDHKPVPCELMEWAKWLEADHKKRVVQQDKVNGRFVSTVFLGLDHNFSPAGPPLLFETMVFQAKEARPNLDNEYQERCSTWDEAIEQHAKAVAWAKEH